MLPCKFLLVLLLIVCLHGTSYARWPRGRHRSSKWDISSPENKFNKITPLRSRNILHDSTSNSGNSALGTWSRGKGQSHGHAGNLPNRWTVSMFTKSTNWYGFVNIYQCVVMTKHLAQTTYDYEYKCSIC